MYELTRSDRKSKIFFFVQLKYTFVELYADGFEHFDENHFSLSSTCLTNKTKRSTVKLRDKKRSEKQQLTCQCMENATFFDSSRIARRHLMSAAIVHLKFPVATI